MAHKSSIPHSIPLAKLETSISFKTKNISFKYFKININILNILKRIGPNTDPCGTPHNNFLHELKF